MDIVISIFSLVILIFSVIIHELAHGSVAFSLGDVTAKYEGRLTLNPLKHLDPFGSVILPVLLFLASSPVLVGWAKPVPVNPYNYKDQKWGSFKVAVAGPLSNLALALVFGLALRFLPTGLLTSIPAMALLFSFVVQINIMLAIFNLVPIPPLDGSWILFHFFPHGLEKVKIFLQQYGMYVLIFLLFFGGLQWLGSVMELLFRLITGIGF